MGDEARDEHGPADGGAGTGHDGGAWVAQTVVRVDTGRPTVVQAPAMTAAPTVARRWHGRRRRRR